MTENAVSAASLPVIGLTGAIGAGKSTVAAYWAERGALVLNADQIGHQQLNDPAIAARLVEEFGAGIRGSGGEINRKALGAIVFAKPTDLHRLEAIVHPAMEAEFRRRLESAADNPRVPLAVLDAAILLEAGWNEWCDTVVFVAAPRPRRLERLARERGWTEEDLDRREAAQWPIARKEKYADTVVDNREDWPKIVPILDELFNRWRR